MTFLEKYELLKKSIPVPAMANDSQSVGCEYSDGMKESKNCYSCEGFFQEECIYAYFSPFNTRVVDCLHTSNSEKSYQLSYCDKCHGSTYLIDCVGTIDCHFSALLNNCVNCYGCVGLTQKKYCIFNRQYNKEEYFSKIDELSHEEPEKQLVQMFELEREIPHPAGMQFNCENCPFGDQIYDSRNCYYIFRSWHNENSGYIFNTRDNKYCWDMFKAAYNERCYGLYTSNKNYECAFLIYSDNNKNCIYSNWLTNCSDCFGCVGLTNKKYCILNNQLTKGQYEKAVKDIKKELGWKVSH